MMAVITINLLGVGGNEIKYANNSFFKMILIEARKTMEGLLPNWKRNSFRWKTICRIFFRFSSQILKIPNRNVVA